MWIEIPFISKILFIVIYLHEQNLFYKKKFVFKEQIFKVSILILLIAIIKTKRKRQKIQFKTFLIFWFYLETSFAYFLLQKEWKKLSELNTFQTRKLNKGYQGTVVNQSCPSLYGGLFKIMTTIPLIKQFVNYLSHCDCGNCLQWDRIYSISNFLLKFHFFSLHSHSRILIYS